MESFAWMRARWLMTNDIELILSKTMRPCWSRLKSFRSAATASCTTWTKGGFQPKILCRFFASVLLPDWDPPRKIRNLYLMSVSVYCAAQGRSSSSTSSLNGRCNWYNASCVLESSPWSATSVSCSWTACACRARPMKPSRTFILGWNMLSLTWNAGTEVAHNFP